MTSSTLRFVAAAIAAASIACSQSPSSPPRTPETPVLSGSGGSGTTIPPATAGTAGTLPRPAGSFSPPPTGFAGSSVTPPSAGTGGQTAGSSGLGEGGAAANGGAGGMGGSAGQPATGGTGPAAGSGASGMPQLPMATGMCPTFTNNGMITVGRMSGIVTYIDPAAKSKPAPGGPLILYYHATASSPAEVQQGFGQANITKVTQAGGVVVSFKSTACQGCMTTDDNYWYVEDDPIQDTVVACAIQQANIDVTHIHALGWSAGALHTMHVALARSNYMASVISYSGGNPLGAMVQNPMNHVASVQTYGSSGDQVIIDFNMNSKTYYSTYHPKGYYIMMCEHPGGHEVDPMVAPHSLEFFLAHPFEVNPEPYASAIPSGWPSYCKNMP